MRTLAVDLAKVLDVVACAQLYGYEEDVLSIALGKMTGPVDDAEIQEFANWYATDAGRSQGYGEQDRDAVLLILTAWRDQFAAHA